MDDIVAVEIEFSSGELKCALTWGRIQDAVDPGPLEQVLKIAIPKLLSGEVPARVRVFDSLQEACHEQYFFEAFFAMSQIPIEVGPNYGSWRDRIDREMHEGKHIHLL